MEPYITEALVKAGIELGTLTFKGTTTLVNSKIQSLKEERNADKLRNTYDEIVNELLSEREQAIRIAQAYKEEYEKLDQKEKVEYEKKSPQIQEKIFEVLTKIRGLEIEKEREMSTWKTTVASATLNVATRYLEQKYSENKKIVEYIGNVKRDILQNLNEFLESSHEEFEDKKRMPGMPQKENIMERYNVNIFVDNSRSETVPLIMDVDYSFENIFRKS